MVIYTASDHSEMKQTNVIGWKVKYLDPAAFTVVLDRYTYITGNAEETTKELIMRVAQASDASMPRKRGGVNPRSSVHWWNVHISALREECLKRRQLSTWLSATKLC